MESCRLLLVLFPLPIFIFLPFANSWGFDGHIIVCRIAQSLLSNSSRIGVNKLLPSSADDDLGRLCPWADTIRGRYPWASDLHFINTPDQLCSYTYNRDCKGRNGEKGRCLTGAIYNYTTQLLTYRDKHPRHNLTEALLFLSHFIGDIHQPLHVGFTSDKGGNTIRVKWFNRKANLHHVWDTDIIKKEEGELRSLNVDKLVNKIEQEIKGKWASEVRTWEACSGNLKTCPNTYASESIKAACQWAYKGVHPGSILKDEYFKTRLTVVEMRLAQAGVRLAATLNRIFI